MAIDNSTKRYRDVDLGFYRERVAPVLPECVLDFHTHTWTTDQRKLAPEQADAAGTKYMVTEEDYGREALRADLKTLFPDRPVSAVCFGTPTLGTDVDKTNAYLAGAVAMRGLFPLMVVGRDLTPSAHLDQAVRQQGFFGYKVRINWHGNDYSGVTVADMIGPEEMRLADELSLVVLLHVPRSGRLADPQVQAGVRTLSRDYPRANIVLAHCGRCYLPDEMAAAVGAVADLDNVYMDTSMVMDPTVLQIAMEAVGPHRLVFGSDLPVAAMRGRRVYVMDHWVDVVACGYAESEYRLASDGIGATFMAWEIVMAIHRAAGRVGLTEDDGKSIFFRNGMRLLEKVMDGAQLAGARQKQAE